jgi:hypothetical protein
LVGIGFKSGFMLPKIKRSGFRTSKVKPKMLVVEQILGSGHLESRMTWSSVCERSNSYFLKCFFLLRNASK